MYRNHNKLQSHMCQPGSNKRITWKVPVSGGNHRFSSKNCKCIGDKGFIRKLDIALSNSGGELHTSLATWKDSGLSVSHQPRCLYRKKKQKLLTAPAHHIQHKMPTKCPVLIFGGLNRCHNVELP